MARKEQVLERLQKEKVDMSQSISTLNNPHSLRQTLPKKMEEVALFSAGFSIAQLFF